MVGFEVAFVGGAQGGGVVVPQHGAGHPEGVCHDDVLAEGVKQK